jgi:hypothetical protein
MGLCNVAALRLGRVGLWVGRVWGWEGTPHGVYALQSGSVDPL